MRRLLLVLCAYAAIAYRSIGMGALGLWTLVNAVGSVMAARIPAPPSTRLMLIMTDTTTELESLE